MARQTRPVVEEDAFKTPEEQAKETPVVAVAETPPVVATNGTKPQVEAVKPASSVEIKERWISLVQDSNKAMKSIQLRVADIKHSAEAEIARQQALLEENLEKLRLEAEAIRTNIPEGVEMELSVEDIFPLEDEEPAPVVRRGRKPKDTSDGKVSKMDAVRHCLDALGADVKPQAIVDYVKKTFNIDIPKNSASNYKSVLGRATPTPKPRGRKPQATVESEDGLSAKDLLLTYISDHPGAKRAELQQYLITHGKKNNLTIELQTMVTRGMIRGDSESGYHRQSKKAAAK